MTLGLTSQTQSRLLAVALLVSVLMAGILTGAALTTVWGGGRRSERHARILMPGPAPRFTGFPRHEMQWHGLGPGLEHRLDLSPEQKRHVDSLIGAQGPRADSLMRAMEERLKALMDSTNAGIETILTPEQRKRFKRYQKQRRDFIVRRLEIVGPPGLPHEEVLPPPE